jgi:hypothetical protein
LSKTTKAILNRQVHLRNTYKTLIFPTYNLQAYGQEMSQKKEKETEVSDISNKERIKDQKRAKEDVLFAIKLISA